MRILLLFFFFYAISTNGQSLEWVHSFEGTSNVSVNRIQLDQVENIYLMGSFSDMVDFDPGPNTFTLNGNNFSAIFIAKYTSDGNFIWANKISCSGATTPGEIVLDNLGNIIVTGSFKKDIYFSSDTLTSVSTSWNDIFISKFDTSGIFLWAKSAGGSSEDELFSCGTDESGNIFVCGDFYSTADFDPGIGVANLTSSGLRDIFILKLSQAGNYLWTKRLGNSDYDRATKLIVSGQNVFITGYFKSYIDFDTGPGISSFNPSVRNPFLLSIDTLGNFNWARHLSSTGFSEGKSLAVDPFGNIYWSGVVQGIMDLDPGSGTLNYTFINLPDIYMVKLDSYGNFLWGNAWGSNNGEILNDMVCDNLGNVCATGFFMGTLDFDPSPATHFLTSIGSEDMFILRISASGNLVRVRQVGSTNFNIGRDIAMNQINYVYIVGEFQGQCDFDPSADDTTLTSPSGLDGGYFAKYKIPISTSVDSYSLVSKVKIFPNPAYNNLFIDLPEQLVNSKIIITDIQGKYIQSFIATTKLNNIEISNLSSGLYFIRVSTDDGNGIFKFVKE